jgi:segregation and condensation protein B
MDISSIIPHIEALIFASEKPLSTMDLVELVNNALGFIEDRASLDQVESAMDAIVEKYSSEFYPFEVKQSGGGWQFLTKKQFHKTVAQLNGEKFLKRLSTAALETLAIIAYKQPVTKGEIENIRGVNCDYAVQKLLEKDLIIITGRKENAPGQPLVYATSKSFMDYFGINSVDDLPKLKDIITSDMVTPTEVGNAHPVDEDIEITDSNRLVVNESGDIEELNEPVVSEDASVTEEVTYANEEAVDNSEIVDADEEDLAGEEDKQEEEEKKQDDAPSGETDESATP